MADETAREKTLNRIRNLLAKAESSEFPEEAQAFQQKAFALMTVLGISEAVLADRGEIDDEIGDVRIVLEGGYASRLASLVHVVAKGQGAKAIYFKAYGGNPRLSLPPRPGYSLILGYRSALERVEFLYTLLLAQAVRGMNAIQAGEAGRTRSYRVGYLTGFIDGIHKRMTTAKEEGEAQAEPGTALVLAGRETRVEHRFAELFPDARNRRSAKVDRRGYEHGERDARTADLGGTRFGEGKTRAIGR